jgi:hypothetical protein
MARTLDANPAELLDVDVQQLASAPALVATHRLGRLEPAQLAQPDALQDRRDRRGGHLEQLGDLWPREAQPPERSDHLDALVGRAVVDVVGRRGPIE